VDTKITWLLIADGEQARIVVRSGPRNAWKTERRIGGTEAAPRMVDTPRAAANENFAQTVAAVIDEAAVAGSFGRLVIAAPDKMLAQLRARLSPAARARLVGCVAKDLVKAPDSAIAGHFSWEVAQAKAAGS
jgi:protein required for attachment to host cells